MARQSWWSKLLFGRKTPAPIPWGAPAKSLEPVETWQDRVRRVQLPPEERQVVSVPSSVPVPRRSPDNASIIREWLALSGLSNATEDDVQFYVAAHEAGKLNFRDVRKIGNAATAQNKNDLGIKYRGILTQEFLATLSAKGLEDPVMAAQMIARPASGRCVTARDLDRARDAGIDMVRFRFGGMLAGHCSFSRRMDGRRVPIDRADLLPASDCEHPDQCGCHWQAWLDILDE